MIDGQIGNNANLTKLLFQLLQVIHHISIMRKEAEGSPVNAFLHKVAELNRSITLARPMNTIHHASIIQKIYKQNIKRKNKQKYI